MYITKQSQLLFEQAQAVIPGGVNSPVRAFKGVGGVPVFFKAGQGAYLVDVDDNQYIDYVGSWGPLILGHCHPNVIHAVSEVLRFGMTFGAPTVLEVRLAEKIISLMPAIEKIRMVNSGTEATMTAIRLARGFTKRNKIIKFNGCYHGHSDGLLVKAGSGLLTLSIPATPGIPACVTECSCVCEFNDLEAVSQLFEAYPAEVAAVIVEPIAGNMGFVMPDGGFLEGLRTLCTQHQALLIFDEVMTGFRVGLGGATARYQITPDLITLGKVIGGGMPVGAVGGRAEIMRCLAPEGAVYQAGTLSGNPLAMAAGLATLVEVEKPGFYEALEAKGKKLMQGLSNVAAACAIPFCGEAVGGMFGFCFSSLPRVRNYQEVAAADQAFFNRFYHAMLSRGVYFAPSMFEAGFISSMHGDREIDITCDAARDALREVLT